MTRQGLPVNGTTQFTPPDVAAWCVEHMKIPPGAAVLDPARGEGAFYGLLGDGAEWCEINEGVDFFDRVERIDYIATNPPFARVIGGKKRPLLWPWVAHCMRIARVKFGLLMQARRWADMLTPVRLATMHSASWPITSVSLLEVPIWAGRYAWVEWSKGGRWCLDWRGRR